MSSFYIGYFKVVTLLKDKAHHVFAAYSRYFSCRRISRELGHFELGLFSTNDGLPTPTRFLGLIVTLYCVRAAKPSNVTASKKSGFLSE